MDIRNAWVEDNSQDRAGEDGEHRAKWNTSGDGEIKDLQIQKRCAHCVWKMANQNGINSTFTDDGKLTWARVLPQTSSLQACCVPKKPKLGDRGVICGVCLPCQWKIFIINVKCGESLGSSRPTCIATIGELS